MKVAVIGAGSWGTAIAQLLATNGNNVGLWARRAEVANSINRIHVNPDYVSDVMLSEDVVATTSIADALKHADAAALVVPSALVRGAAEAAAPYLPNDMPVVICSKGVEAKTGLVPLAVFDDVVGHPERLAALSGPNHAEEVVRGIPAATVIASSSPDTAALFRDLFAAPTFRTYTSDDVLGVELCAAFKNVIAIAVGVSYGLGYGDNTAAVLMTRGQAEMSRLVARAGGNVLTCMGLAGTGDLIATCMSRHSRNRMFGEALAHGESVDDYTARTHMVVEGSVACKTLDVLSKRYDVELPITQMVRGMVWEGLDPHEVGAILAARPLKPELYGIDVPPQHEWGDEI